MTGIFKVVLLSICMIVAHGSTAIASPSFNCAKASLPDEFVICSSNRLSELDRIVASAYAYLRSSLGSTRVKQIGLPLLRMRQSCKSNFDCIQARQIDAIRAYQAAGAPVSLPDWTRPKQAVRSQTIIKTNVVETTINIDVKGIQAELNSTALQKFVLQELLEMQKLKSASGDQLSAFAIGVLRELSGDIDTQMGKLKKTAQSKYGTSIFPNNADKEISARDKSRNFPPVPYYVAGQQVVVEFWLEPLVKDTGELAYRLNFIDPEEEAERITSQFELNLKELADVRTALSTTYEWSETAKKNKIRRRFKKTAVCFPEAQCVDKVTGNTSTQVDFLIYEDGATGARIVRNKGAYVQPYNLSIDSVALLGAYLDFVAAAAEAEFNAGSVTEEALNDLFK